MAKRAPDPEGVTAAALATVAGKLGGKISAGSQLRGTVAANDGELEVEITMVVRRKPTAEARIDHLTQAMILFVTDPWRAEHCAHYIKGRRRGEWSLSKGGACRNRPTHVTAFRAFDNTIAYAFGCATHSKREIGPNVFAVIRIPSDRLKAARTEIKSRAELKAKLEKMTPEERIAQDAKEIRHPAAAAIAADIAAERSALTETIAIPVTIGDVDPAGVFRCNCGASHRRGPVNGTGFPADDTGIKDAVYRCLSCGKSGTVGRRPYSAVSVEAFQ